MKSIMAAAALALLSGGLAPLQARSARGSSFVRSGSSVSSRVVRASSSSQSFSASRGSYVRATAVAPRNGFTARSGAVAPRTGFTRTIRATRSAGFAPKTLGRSPRGLNGRMRRADAGGGDGGGGTPDGGTPVDPGPQPVAGALIRTEGLGFKYDQIVTGPSFHTIEAGDRIGFDASKGYALSTTGVFQGPRDTAPGANSGATTASGGNAITPNN